MIVKKMICWLDYNQMIKKTNSKYLYDKKGSELFDKITKLKEYYPTKKELEILENKAKEIKNILPQNSAQFGSGSNNK